MQKQLNFIGGEWVKSESGQVFETRNPADTREAVAEYPLSGATDAQAAIEAARAALSGWSAMTPVARGRILSKASAGLEARKGQLADLLTREEGKTLAESAGEVQRAIDIFRFFGGLSYTLGGQTIPHDLPGNLLYTVRQPIGVVALITPWNFPIAIPSWKLAPALICGNTVVMKPASQAPGMALEIARALHEAGLPRGALNVVIGEGRTVGNELAGNPAVRALSFTGSFSVGDQIYQQLAKRMARSQMEMGPAVSKQQLVSNLEYVDGAVAQGASLLAGGQPLKEGELEHGYFMAPTVLGDVQRQTRIACEEVFGPVVAIIEAGDFDDALAIANGVEMGLSASIVTRDLKKAMIYAERIEAGVVKVNQISTGLALQAPFGGVKKSSTDTFKEQGAIAIDFYSRIKTVYLDYSA